MALHMPFFNSGAASGSSARSQARVVAFTVAGLLCFAVWVALGAMAVHIISRHLL
jgi:hypothetical protein